MSPHYFLKMYHNIQKLIIAVIIVFCTSSVVLAKPLSEYYRKIEDELIKKTNQLDVLLDERGSFYIDEKIEKYVNELGLNLAPSDFNDPNININFKVIKDPTLNAMALPNGTIWVHTGLLTRLQNEAQLAFILGHELSHIINKDGLYFYESATTNIMFAKILDIGLSAASFFIGLYADLGQLGLAFLTKAAISGYGRKKEARADLQAVELMVKAGYDPNEAIEMFNIFIAEKEKYHDRIEIYFLSDHPSNKFRRKELQELISERFADVENKKTEDEQYKKITYLLKRNNTLVNIKIDRLQHAVDTIETLIEENNNDPANYYLLGECYRLMAENRKRLKYELSRKNWLKVADAKEEDFKVEYFDKAQKQYFYALGLDEAFADSYKGLGLLCRSQGNIEEAISHFEKYLELKPNARDRRFARAILSRMREEKQKGEEKND